MAGELPRLDAGGPGRETAMALGPAPAPALRPPAPAGSLFDEGIERLNRGEAHQAAACFERALEIAPDFADAHVGLGIAFAVDSRVYPALDHLEKAVELEPENFFAHFKLGQLCFKLRVPDKGYAEMARALGCTTRLEERRLVAQLLREERQRERNGVTRPRWNRPFSRAAFFVGIGMGLAALLLLVFHLG